VFRFFLLSIKSAEECVSSQKETGSKISRKLTFGVNIIRSWLRYCKILREKSFGDYDGIKTLVS
jgi:hypothetical protein